MENKNVGWLLLGVSVLIVLLVFLFNNTLMESVRNSCFIQHGDVQSCEMYDSVNYQTYLALVIVGVLIITSLFLIFSKPNEKIIIRKVKEKKIQREVDLSSFRPEEKKIYNLVKGNGAIFQADLIEKTGFSKARMTRIIDKLEGSGLVERKRRGMTNVVVLRED
ncbi:MAG TPA: MarR family transcriptional regulator [Candidatus Nanoarchaeia archaeon]|nr:MarR family transcriptional regulator [Candidatus Nanoarchaeia archaeon]